MNINIGLLYPSRLSLYGESANAKALQYYLKKQEIDASIEAIDDLGTVDLKKYDFLYMGSGLESGLKFAAANLFQNKDKISEYIDADGYFLVTGNAMSALKHFNYFKFKENDDYLVADVTGKYISSNDDIRAFQNTKYLVIGTKNPVFDIYEGYGNDGSKQEGFRHKNLIVTSLIGPILAINAGLRNYFVDRIKESHGTTR